MSFKKKT